MEEFRTLDPERREARSHTTQPRSAASKWCRTIETTHRARYRLRSKTGGSHIDLFPASHTAGQGDGVRLRDGESRNRTAAGANPLISGSCVARGLPAPLTR